VPAASSSTHGFDEASVALKATRLIGIVGYTPVLDVFPLGRPLLDMLRRRLPADESIAIENMTWSPLHIVQQFQDPRTVPLERLVLVGAAAISVEPGRVRALHWRGGKLPDQCVQDRIYEAVTGIVDIENTLVIGEHFGVWPTECFVVEADMPANTFGRMVIADSENWADDVSLQHHLGFSPAKMRNEIATVTAALAEDGLKSGIILEDKVSTAIAAGATFLRTRFATREVGA
jgi:hypothetical protein